MNPYVPAPARKLVFVMLLVTGCTTINQSVTTSLPATPTRAFAATATRAAVPAPTIAQETVKEYKNKSFGLCLRYPASWLGPEVYEHKDGFVFEVGTDKVFPYGTSLEDRVHTKVDAYYIMLTFTKKPSTLTIEKYRADQPWLSQYLSLLSLKDGESKSDLRGKFTRIRPVAAGDYSGAEFIATTAETAQTEFFYQREAFLINPQYNTFRISGSPENVKIANTATRRDDFKRVDEANLGAFRRFVDSISACNS